MRRFTRCMVAAVLLFLCLSVSAEAGTDPFFGLEEYKLTGKEQMIYTLLSVRARRIAMGEIPSTVIEIPICLLTDQMEYTADELELTRSLMLGKTIRRNARMAMYDRLDLSRIYHAATALLRDEPLNLFWYDRYDGGMYFGYPDLESDGKTIWFSEHAKFSVALIPDAVYAGAEEMTTDPSKTAAAMQKMRAAAREIVRSGDGMEDIDRIRYYVDRIAQMADYDYEALDSPEMEGISAPWNITSVLDGDPVTRSVCEGYARTLTYLCRNTRFSGDVICYTAYGELYGSIGHVWNIVRIDGKNYLVDPTNSDDDAQVQGRRIVLEGAAAAQDGVWFFVDRTTDQDVFQEVYVYDEFERTHRSLEERRIVPAAERIG